MTQPAQITETMTVPEIVERFPQTAPVFRRYGINTTYKALEYENLVASAKVNQIDLAALLKDLNASLN